MFRHLLRTLICLSLLAACGCGGAGDGITRVPVAGSISVSGQPLQGKTGSVFFKPNAPKGHNSNPAGGTGLVARPNGSRRAVSEV